MKLMMATMMTLVMKVDVGEVNGDDEVDDDGENDDDDDDKDDAYEISWHFERS